ncbi:hypothetical protein GGI07_002544 [Coemansia sp. Benny D115]|nr:hypothetical protein GGI07_002544 [Coemansia sp. Benny D115]
MDVPGTNTVGEAAFNVLNSIIGSGIIGLPYAFYGSGMLTGIVMLAVVGAVSQFASYALVLTGKRTGAMHYSEVARVALGSTGYKALNVSVVVSLFGVVTTYLVILGDIILGLRLTYLPGCQWATRSAIISLTAAVFILPLLFFRHSGPLAKFSVVSVVALPAILMLIAIRAPLYSVGADTRYPVVLGGNVFPALGVLSFSFCSAHASFQNFLGLQTRSMRNWHTATTRATWAAVLICCVFAVVGLRSFGADVQANVFLNFPHTDLWINIARLAFCLTLVLTFPLTFYPIRDTLVHWLGIHDAESLTAAVVRYVVTVAALVLVCITAVWCTDLGLAYELVGAASATTISFIFPALIFLSRGTDFSTKAALGDPAQRVPILLGSAETIAASVSDSQRRSSMHMWVAAWLTLGFGVVVFVVGTANTLLK